MIDPARAVELAEAIRRLYVEAETDILRRVARRLARGIDDPGWAESKLAEVSALRRELERIATRLDTVGPSELEALLEQAFRAGGLASSQALGAPLATHSSRFAIEALLRSATTKLHGVHLPILRTATDAYRAVIAEAAGFGVTGVQTRRETAWRAMGRFADRGVTGFVDSRGRHWDLASYTEMASRSALGQAHLEGHLGQISARGHDLVRISDSPDECPLCRPWEGRILSVGGGNPRYPSLSFAREAGLFHSTCTHGLAPWIPGLSRPFGTTADKAGFEERARHRANEHHIRHWKRREAVAEAMGDERGAQRAAAKVASWQAEQRRFTAATGRRRDYRREQIAGAR